MAYLHAGAYGCLYAVLVVGDDQCGCQLVRLPISDPDSSENTAQDMGFHGFSAMCLFYLREEMCIRDSHKAVSAYLAFITEKEGK